MGRTKPEKKPDNQEYICSECGNVIEGDHVFIRTRRRTGLHIHYGCMLVRKEKRIHEETSDDKVHTL